jgi:tRNA A-37 threonylcarbamoyl transferase component Bud32
VKPADKEIFTWVVDEDIAREDVISYVISPTERWILRCTPKRCVSLVKTDGRPLLVKRFHYFGIDGMLKSLLRGTPAAREWNALREARARGLPSARPLALGKGGGILKGKSVLVAEAIENARPLGDYLFGAARASGKKRWQLVREVAALVRKAHDLGFYQPDLHPGNVLVRLAGERIEVFLVDFQRVRVTDSVPPKKRWHNLAVLYGGCPEISSTDCLRVLKHYLCLAPALPSSLQTVAHDIERQGWRHRYSLWRRRQRRCVRENQEFMRVQNGRFAGFVRRKYGDGSLKLLAQEPDQIAGRPDARMVKDSKTTTVVVAAQSAGAVYIKRYNYQGLTYAAKDFFRSSRARRAWIAANSLRMRGIPVALPLAYLERRSWGVLRESYVLTEAIVGDSVRDIFRRYDKQGSPLEEKRILLRELGALLKKMHASGVAHRDLKGNNIIAQKLAARRHALHIVDFDGISLGPVSRQRRVKNLARAAEECHRHSSLTRTDRLRFLKAYLGSAAEKKWKELWRFCR